MNLATDVASFRCPILIWAQEKDLWFRCKSGRHWHKSALFCLSPRDELAQWVS